MMDKLISQQAAIDKIKKRLFETAFNNVGVKQDIDETLADVAENRLENWFGELPSVQPDTTTHDSISAETGENDDDRTSGDCISRTQAIDEIHEDAEWLASQGSDWQVERMERDKSILKSLPSVQPETNCSEIPNNSDTISRQAVKDIFTELYGISAIGSVLDKYEWADICETTANELPSVQPFHNITMTDVLKYIDDMPEDVWQEFTACLECRGWKLQWCGGDFA